MAVRSNALVPFSIQAILNRKEESRHMSDLDVCFSKSACWKIFDEMDAPDRSDEREHKSYDSDSGLSEDNDSKAQTDAKPEKDADLADDTDPYSPGDLLRPPLLSYYYPYTYCLPAWSLSSACTGSQ
ncbi:homeobox protein Nkx-3.2-like [Sinocyclocheilus grahami]|uniref:homeobox protein Nkx-3.2-like n=1 Tax=Sinocyclocheilus grahami TaxID=75366 RepID=UPI0007ACBD69|nr:PREDICTED: homeobox protein Nkx-3.2-like [Sinocyclocheilus grahami]